MRTERPHRPLPDFVGIGALKAGTSYLDAMLRSHPGLSLPAHLKEVEFFSRHHTRGVAWYTGQFAADDGRPRGEISPQYLHDPACAERIRAANPDAKVLVSVRQPVARAYSQYRHWVQETGFAGDFAAFLAVHPGALERSHYWSALQPYRDAFPAEQIHVIVFEDMIVEPLPVLQALYTFLEVDPAHVPHAVGEAVNVSGAPRFPRLYVQSKRLSRWLYAHGAGRTVSRLKTWGPGTLLSGRENSAAAALVPPAELNIRLGHEFRDDAKQLSSYLDRDLMGLWGLNDS
jgi:hypothetical protein